MSTPTPATKTAKASELVAQAAKLAQAKAAELTALQTKVAAATAPTNTIEGVVDAFIEARWLAANEKQAAVQALATHKGAISMLANVAREVGSWAAGAAGTVPGAPVAKTASDNSSNTGGTFAGYDPSDFGTAGADFSNEISKLAAVATSYPG